MNSTSLEENMESIIVLGSQLSLPSRKNLFPHTSFVSNRKKQVHLINASPPSFTPLHLDNEESNRNFKKLSPSKWTHYFHSANVDIAEMSAVEREIEVLKLNVKETLVSESKAMDGEKKRILLIYLLISLGLAYHFEDEINKILTHSFKKIEDMMVGENDLYTVSILFWVFRTYGHNMSSDVFKRFQGHDGKFKDCLVDDAKGILSLYEAANMATTTDYILDEALSFTSIHLESLVAGATCPPHLSKRIRNALTLPQHSNMEILVATERIPLYEQEEDHDGVLLKFAKLNFKFLQLHYRQELKIITKWYKDHDLASNLPPYYRDRIVELHFFVIAMYFEPKFSRARIMLTKFFKVVTILDDTCDRYASISEAESLVNSLERWALDDTMERHPEFLTFVFNFILNVFEEFEEEARPEGRSFGVEATREEFKTLVKANLDLAKWALAGHVPRFEDYMEVGEVEITVYVSLAGTLMTMEDIPTKEAFEWLKSRPKITRVLSTKGRLRNDMAGYEDDMSRGNFTTGINCYKNQYGVSEKEAFRELYKMVAKLDKIINEELLKKSDVPRQVLKTTINLSRMMNVTYNENEGYTIPEIKTYEYINALFVDEISV